MERLSGRSTIVAAKEQVSCSMAEEAVVLDLKAGVYYGLNEVGARVWSLVQEPRNVSEIRDAILEELPPDELDAVFGHEVGHARHGHIWFYALFLALSMTVLQAAFLLADLKPNAAMWLVFVGYLFVGLATGLPALLGARVAQGLGAQVVQPPGVTLLPDYYPVESRIQVKR